MSRQVRLGELRILIECALRDLESNWTLTLLKASFEGAQFLYLYYNALDATPRCGALEQRVLKAKRLYF